MAEALFELERLQKVSSEKLEAWLVRMDDELQETHPQADAPWEIDDTATLIEHIRSFGVGDKIEAAEDYTNFVGQVRALQLLDSWHFPLVPLGGATRAPKLAHHQSAADRLIYEGFFGSSLKGRMIPGVRGPKWSDHILERNRTILMTQHVTDPILTGSGLSYRPQVLRQLLDHTIFLPWTLDASEADTPDSVLKRLVRIGYATAVSRTVSPTPPTEPIKVAIAPLAQEKSDVRFEIPVDGARYRVVPSYSTTRITNVIKRAFLSDVNYLYFPELTIDETKFDEVAKTIANESKLYLQETGSLPAFRGLFAGISGTSDSNGTNYVVALDMFGKQIWRQNKLFRWNLNIEQSERFGLTLEFDPILDPLKEDIIEGDELTIFDSPDLGRSMLFICADMSSNSPGDWLLTSAGVNWVYAPIMDQSIGWKFDTRGMQGPWITRRAHRAAFTSTARVMVTNSMSLTHRVNETNQRKGDTRIASDCGIAFFLDATDEVASYCLVRAPLENSGDVLSIVEWGAGWAKL